MVVAEQLITANLDIWSSAVRTKSAAGRGKSNKLELYGIKKLRELILELAVRGLLVPQDPNDEPARELLKKIAAEKARLVKEKKIKKQNTLAPIEESEAPLGLPEGWHTARFGNVVFNRDAERVPLAVAERKSRQGEYDYYGASGVIDSIDDYLFDKPLLLIGEDGANLINRSTPIAFMARGNYWVNNHAHVLDGLTEDLLLYVCLHINAISLEPYVTGTAQPKMNQAKMNSILLAIPPAEEQKRIVAKVDELMALCDQLEQQQETSITAQQTLVKTLLDALTTASERDGFTAAWARIADHFDTLFTTEWSIDQLKQTILQLAVMGKLVPQDPNDEPASELLKKIAAAKDKLSKESKIKKQKPLRPIGENETPFKLPEGWEWIRFFGGNTVRSELVSASDFWDENQIAPDSIEKNTGRLLFHRTVAESGAKGPNNKFYKGQIIYSKIRPSLNKVILAPYDGLCSADMYPINCHLFAPYILLVMLSEVFLTQVRIAENRIKMPKLNLDSLGKFLIPIPPFDEQQRIVDKVDELTIICDGLKFQINESQTFQTQLANALSVQALNQ